MDAFDLRLWKGFEEAGGVLSEPAIIDQISIDSRRIYSSNTLFVALPGTSHDGHDFVSHAAESKAKYALVRKDWIPDRPIKNTILLRVSSPLRAFQEIAACYRKQLSAAFVAVGGSYGKTMVKDLLCDLLSPHKKTVSSPESFNSQIGVPLSILRVSKGDEIAIIEAGISEIGEMDILAELIQPAHAVVTTIGRKHQHSLGSMETTQKEINKLLRSVPKDGWILSPFSSEGARKRYCWSEDTKDLPHANYLLSESGAHQYQIRFPNGKIHHGIISGGHTYFIDLVNTAIKAAWLLGCDAAAISDVLSRYHPEPIRTEIWPSPQGVTFVNEPYCSDPLSVDLALKHFSKTHTEGRKIFLFGGLRGKTAHLEHDYRRIGRAIANAKIDKLYLVGKHPWKALEEEVGGHSEKFTGFDEAAAHLKKEIKPSDMILIKGEKKVSFNTLTQAFHGSFFSNQYLINFAAIDTNLKVLRKKLPKNTRIMPMIKAQGYGTNEQQMAKFLAGVNIDILGVSYPDEGVSLKRAGVKQSIFTLNAAVFEASKVVEYGLEVGVSDAEMISALAAECERQKKTVKLHLHIDTGMSRLGCRPEVALTLAQLIKTHPRLILDGVFTHFACSDNPAEDDFTIQQIKRFDAVIEELVTAGIDIPWKHAANSAGALRFDLPHYNMARIGLSLLGLMPGNELREAYGLKLAISLTSSIAGINLCQKGDTVSYGRNFKVAQESGRIAVIPIGYFDGLHRHYSGNGYAIIHGEKAPYVGNICMDYMMIDVSHIPKACIGDPVLIFGEDEFGNYLPPEELASQGGSIVHELITCLGPRIQRVFIHDENQKSC